MALDRTSGYDMLVQLSETELNDQLATAFLAGGIIPPSMTLPVAIGPVTGTADLPVQHADRRSRPAAPARLTVPFANSQLAITAPCGDAGSARRHDRRRRRHRGAGAGREPDRHDGLQHRSPTVTVTFDAASQAILAPALAVAGLTLAQAQTMVADIVLQQLRTGIGRLDLTPPIPVVDDTDPTTIYDIDVTTINDTTAADRDASSSACGWRATPAATSTSRRPTSSPGTSRS